MNNSKEQAVLILEDGTRFVGKSHGCDCVEDDGGGKAFGIVAFHTGMVGYQQLLTDPASKGLLLVQTFPLIGNYGINSTDFESDSPQVAGYIAREICDAPSNYKCEGNLESYFKENGVIAITNIDTRQLTRHIRENGEMRGVIATGKAALDQDTLLTEVKQWNEEARPRVNFARLGTAAPVDDGGEKKPVVRLAMLNFGAAESQARIPCEMGAALSIYSGNVTAIDIIARNPDGILISNGGGIPNINEFSTEIALIKELLNTTDIPILAIGLGHQLLALANGMTVSRMKCGHRGSNQPVYCIENGRTYITSQNHGYTVDAESVKNCEIAFKNANDNTIEGLRYENALSVQFIPDGIASKQSTAFIYEEFFARMNKAAEKKGKVN